MYILKFTFYVFIQSILLCKSYSTYNDNFMLFSATNINMFTYRVATMRIGWERSIGSAEFMMRQSQMKRCKERYLPHTCTICQNTLIYWIRFVLSIQKYENCFNFHVNDYRFRYFSCFARKTIKFPFCTSITMVV